MEERHIDVLADVRIGLARVEEKLRAVIERLETHMLEEHADFRETLVDMKAMAKAVSALERKLDHINIGVKVTRWVLATAAAVISWWIAVKADIFG